MEGGSLPPELDSLETRLGHRFADRGLLAQALTHQSRAHEQGDLRLGNERLEFLGDAVLDLLISELLMEEHPDADEGVLSKARAASVNQRALAVRARALELGQFVRLGRGERRSGGADKESILANVFEALLGALYLDGGLPVVRSLLEREFQPYLGIVREALGDAKTRLQERAQALGRPIPEYRTVAERGPDHAKEFEVEVCIGGERLAHGAGRSKQIAEQAAAQLALAGLEGDDS